MYRTQRKLVYTRCIDSVSLCVYICVCVVEKEGQKQREFFKSARRKRGTERAGDVYTVYIYEDPTVLA